MNRLFKLLFRNTARTLVGNAMYAGVILGYKMGYAAGQAEKSYRGVILSGNLEEQVEEILTKAGF